MREHHYASTVTWTGNRGTGTSGYRDYDRDCVLAVEGKPTIAGSSDKTFRGDPNRHNPEDLLVIALSQCHLLAYLHLCVTHDVVVTDYTDDATGTMITGADGLGAFSEVVLHPKVTIAAGDPDLAQRLHDDAHHACFVAASVNFTVRHEPVITVGGPMSHITTAP